VLAGSDPPPPRAAAASGAPVDLPAPTGRRDGSGAPGSQPIAACAGPVATAAAALTGVRG
jgi:DNA gyrase subunit A